MLAGPGQESTHQRERQHAYNDVLHGLLNSSEFMFNH
jgi:hypothetical protein